MSVRFPSERVAAGGSHSSESFLVSEEVTPCFGGSGPWVGGKGFVAVQSQGFRVTSRLLSPCGAFFFVITLLRFFKHHPLCMKIFVLLNLEEKGSILSC